MPRSTAGDEDEDEGKTAVGLCTGLGADAAKPHTGRKRITHTYIYTVMYHYIPKHRDI